MEPVEPRIEMRFICVYWARTILQAFGGFANAGESKSGEGFPGGCGGVGRPKPCRSLGRASAAADAPTFGRGEVVDCWPPARQPRGDFSREGDSDDESYVPTYACRVLAGVDRDARQPADGFREMGLLS